MTSKKILYSFAGSLPASPQAKREASLTMQNLLKRAAGGADGGRLTMVQWEGLNSRIPDDLEEITEVDCDDEQ
ncbi:hypothetical protein [Candidatus Burkholderia verschuerenii]|uniref:hypothetical protein n=1 Tax=Candidatus Burkholderia verschuerenii TaxID=242163 RepID=UPI00067D1F4E|nr:hypothetical protein [Candidatus Burkholderia verschuerenii]